MVANKGQENLIPMNERSKDEVRELGQKGGIRSGEVRREKATMKATLEMLLNETNKNGKTYRELATLGLLKGAINGNAQNYRTILETLGELLETESKEAPTPSLEITIKDNSKLEGKLYEANKH
jgi:hypothetical protein